MSDQTWKQPWWERPEGHERLNEEIARFTQLRPQWKLIHDPRTGSEVNDERYHGFWYWSMGHPKECFIWRGEMRVSYAKPGERLRTIRWTVDFIYPPTYPFDRILVRVISPVLEATRHVFGPRQDLLCYMPFSPNAWTTGTTNTNVMERVRNWFRGYLSEWQHGEHIELPEPLSHVVFSGYDVYLLDHLYQRHEMPGYGWLTLTTRSSPQSLSGEVALSHTLRDVANDSELESSDFRAKVIYEVVLLKGNLERTFEVAWVDIEEKLPFITSPKKLFEVLHRSWPLSNSRFHKWWSNLLETARRANHPVWLLVRFPTPRGTPEWVGYLIWPSQRLHPDCPWLSIAEVGLGTEIEQLPQAWRSTLHSELPFQKGRFRALRLLPARQRDLFRRSQGLPYEASQLHTKRVAVIGCGALGSPAIALLARSGVGHFTLADGDTLMHWNVMRHELNLSSARSKKTDGLWNLLAHINPYASVRKVGHLSTPHAIAEAIHDADVVLVAVADDALEENINRVALSLNKPTLYARGLARMEVGRIHRVIPGEDACFVCLHAHANGVSTPQSDTWLAVEGGTGDLIYDEGCGVAAVPGASVDTHVIGNLLARRALDLLLGNNTQENHWIMVNRAQPTARDARLWQEGVIRPLLLEPIEGCPQCDSFQSQHKGGKLVTVSSQNPHARQMKEEPSFERVELYASAFATIQNESAFYGRLETGGVLMGYVDEERRTLVVTHATDAGPHARHGRTTFARDTPYCQERINQWAIHTQGREDYVGEWHRHPSLSTSPSPTDRASLTGIASSSSYHVSQPIMLIFGLPNHKNPDLFAVEVHSFTTGHMTITALPWIVVGDSSHP